VNREQIREKWKGGARTKTAEKRGKDGRYEGEGYRAYARSGARRRERRRLGDYMG